MYSGKVIRFADQNYSPCPNPGSCPISEELLPRRRTVRLTIHVVVKFSHNGRLEEGFIVSGPLHKDRYTNNSDHFPGTEAHEKIHVAHAYEIMGTSRRVRDQRIVVYATEIEPVIWKENIVNRAIRFITRRKTAAY